MRCEYIASSAGGRGDNISRGMIDAAPEIRHRIFGGRCMEDRRGRKSKHQTKQLFPYYLSIRDTSLMGLDRQDAVDNQWINRFFPLKQWNLHGATVAKIIFDSQWRQINKEITKTTIFKRNFNRSKFSGATWSFQPKTITLSKPKSAKWHNKNSELSFPSSHHKLIIISCHKIIAEHFEEFLDAIIMGFLR